ncbi:MAG TPA: hypothetical protein VF771_19760 [Longimicrobiaceae bacterium]
MSPLLEIGRHALEGVEVMLALATTALLGAGLLFSRHTESADSPRLDAEAPRDR